MLVYAEAEKEAKEAEAKETAKKADAIKGKCWLPLYVSLLRNVAIQARKQQKIEKQKEDKERKEREAEQKQGQEEAEQQQRKEDTGGLGKSALHDKGNTDEWGMDGNMELSRGLCFLSTYSHDFDNLTIPR